MDSKCKLSEIDVVQINKDISDLKKALNDMDFKVDRLTSIIRIFYNVDSMGDILKRGENHIKNINFNIENMEQLITVLKSNEENGVPIEESGIYYDKNNIKDYNDFYKYLNESCLFLSSSICISHPCCSASRRRQDTRCGTMSCSV